jgi:hypothetical protein
MQRIPLINQIKSIAEVSAVHKDEATVTFERPARLRVADRLSIGTAQLRAAELLFAIHAVNQHGAVVTGSQVGRSIHFDLA